MPLPPGPCGFLRNGFPLLRAQLLGTGGPPFLPPSFPGDGSRVLFTGGSLGGLKTEVVQSVIRP